MRRSPFATELESALIRLMTIGLIVGAAAAIVVVRVQGGSSMARHRGESSARPNEPAGVDHGVDPAAVVLPRGSDGLFHASVTINGDTIDCIVDTGASVITLGDRDGGRAGVPVARLRFSTRIQTAGGLRPAARTELEDVVLAGRRFQGVAAIVVRDPTLPCLLGQELLARMRSTEFRGDSLILR